MARMSCFAGACVAECCALHQVRCGGGDWSFLTGLQDDRMRGGGGCGEGELRISRIGAECFALHQVRCGGCDWVLATDRADHAEGEEADGF